MSRRLLAVAASVLLAGCFLPESTTIAEKEWNVARKTATESLTFENPAKRAIVDVGARTDAGTATLRILDADEKEVFSLALSATGEALIQETTADGKPGNWTARIAFAGYTGKVALLASRP